ncbi:hypothetical protein BJ508DRAFT_365881 [Ascobolus immersus RN42]|uniref:BTB domain-containing protein n=1 Tax=Ascobolus immersus RN42 TaxID=1160509 RepID=A0A3N4HQ24_ASCIM|nr:hypothetical protein BJ508DRAFT_365881 [Ascobolus immersus RN42]
MSKNDPGTVLPWGHFGQSLRYRSRKQPYGGEEESDSEEEWSSTVPVSDIIKAVRIIYAGIPRPYQSEEEPEPATEAEYEKIEVLKKKAEHNYYNDYKFVCKLHSRAEVEKCRKSKVCKKTEDEEVKALRHEYEASGSKKLGNISASLESAMDSQGPVSTTPAPDVEYSIAIAETVSISKKRTFEDYFADDQSENVKLKVILFPSTSDEPKHYFLNPAQLKEASGYFAALMRFSGAEYQAGNVTLDEGFEGLEDAFEEFVSWVDSDQSAVHIDSTTASPSVVSHLVIPADRLLASSLRDQAVDELAAHHSSADGLLQDEAIEVAKIIYGGSIRPYGSISNEIPDGSWLDGLDAFAFKEFGFICGCNKFAEVECKCDCKRHSNHRPTGSDECECPGFGCYCNDDFYHHQVGDFIYRQCQGRHQDSCLEYNEERLESHKKEFVSDMRRLGYRNSKARKVAANHFAESLEDYRRMPAFKVLVEENGEFAYDLFAEDHRAGAAGGTCMRILYWGLDMKQIPTKESLPMKEKSKKRTFAESFGYELIHVVLAPSTSPEPKRYHLHATKLANASEYFAALLRFPGVEKEMKEVRLEEGYEGLEDAFETFAECIYQPELR